MWSVTGDKVSFPISDMVEVIGTWVKEINTDFRICSKMFPVIGQISSYSLEHPVPEPPAV